MKAWRRRHPERARDARATENAKRGGYAAPTMPESECPQPADMRCELCGGDDHNFSQRGLQRDHCHGSGAHRGWICLRCNFTLGNVESDDAEKIRALFGAWRMTDHKQRASYQAKLAAVEAMAADERGEPNTRAVAQALAAKVRATTGYPFKTAGEGEERWLRALASAMP